jgi:hypothetical protein
MAASIKRIIRRALPEIIQSKDATTGERLGACRLLWKNLASATKGKPRGRAFPKKARDGANDSEDGLARILSAVSEGGSSYASLALGLTF